MDLSAARRLLQQKEKSILSSLRRFVTRYKDRHPITTKNVSREEWREQKARTGVFRHIVGVEAWNPQAESGSLKGFGGMLGIEWKSDAVHRDLGPHVKLMINQTSLGDPVPRVMKRKEEKDWGVPARYTRVSIGLEEPEDLIADFRQAIAKCQ